MKLYRYFCRTILSYLICRNSSAQSWITRRTCSNGVGQLMRHRQLSLAKQFLAQLWEYETNEVVPFRLHVTKGGPDKDANGFPITGHLM
jgi:hypothetical protein